MLAVSFPHVVKIGTEFDHHKWTSRYWIALYLATLGAVLAHRLGGPVRNARRHGFRIAAIVPEAPGVISMHLSGRNLAAFGAAAGQFVTVRFAHRGWWHKAHPLSLSALVSADGLRLTVKGLGDDTERMDRLPVGTRVIVEGPFGAFTEQARRQPKVLLVAAGIGITPIRALFESLSAAPGDISLLYRATSVEGLVFRDELDSIAERRGFDIRYLVGSRHEQPDLGDPAVLVGLVADIGERDVYVCGPALFTESVRHAASQLTAPVNVHFERFAF